MADIIVALFQDSNAAGEAAGQIKGQNLADDISVISKKIEGYEVDETTHTIQRNKDVSEGVVAGGVLGAGAAALAAVLTGASAITIPALGIFIAGPLAATLGAAAAGSVVGGLVGALVDYGIPDNDAQMFEEKVSAGQTLIAAHTSAENEDEVTQILTDHGADSVRVYHLD